MKRTFSFASLFLALMCPLVGWSQSSILNFPLPFDASSGSEAGYAVVNPTQSTAPVLFTVYDQNGNATGSASVNVPAGGQAAKLFADLFRNSTATGWVQATSTVSGIQGMTIGGNFVNQVDGTASADPASDQIFPLLGNTTTIAIANPLPATLNLTVNVFNSMGNEIIASVNLTLPGFGWAAEPIMDLPSQGQQITTDGSYVRITADGVFSATAMISGYRISMPEIALYNGIDVSKTTTTLNFPHVVSGENSGVTYTTALGLTNLSKQSQVIMLLFTPDGGRNSQSSQFILAPGQSIQSEIGYPELSGWLQVKSGGPFAAAMAVVNAAAEADGIAAVQSQTAGSASMVFSQIANSGNWTTGLTFTNMTQVDTTVEVFAMNPNGSLIGGPGNSSAAKFALNAGTQMSALLSDLIPQTRNLAGGFVFVRTIDEVPITAIETFSLQNGGPIANLPAGTLPSNLVFTPPGQ